MTHFPAPTIIAPTASGTEQIDRPRPVVIGGSNFDFLCRVTEPELRLDGSTLFGNIRYLKTFSFFLASSTLKYTMKVSVSMRNA